MGESKFETPTPSKERNRCIPEKYGYSPPPHVPCNLTFDNFFKPMLWGGMFINCVKSIK